MTGRRIIILFPHITMAGGALNYTIRLAQQLRETGACVAIVTLCTDRKLLAPLNGVEIISLHGPLTSSLRYWLLFPLWQRRLERKIADWGADVLVPQVFPANWWGWLYKRHHPESRLVWICHEPSAFIHSHAWIKALTPWWKRFLALLLRPALARIDMYLSRFCDAAIANSRFTADAMAAIYGFSPDRIASPGIDGAIYAAQETHQRKGIITVAHLSKFKRVDFLLDVFGELLTYHPELHYTIVGIGEEEDALKKKAVLLGIRSQVTFHGTADSRELVSLYRSSRLFLHGARNEPFGMAPLEAIASGTPVVAHQSGGIQEFITARCGRLVASSDPAVWGKQCAEYLDIILAQPDYHKDVRTCAGEFDWCRTLEPARDLIVREAQQHGLPQKHKMVNL